MNLGKKRSNYFGFPMLVVSLALISLLGVAGYFLLYLPNSIGASVTSNFNSLETSYKQINELVSDLDSRYNATSLANSEFERIDQDKNNLKKGQSIVAEAQKQVTTSKDSASQSYYQSSEGFLDTSYKIFDEYDSQLNFYKCLFGNINDQTNTWTLIVGDYTKINPKTPVDANSKASVKTLIDNLNKNSASVNNLSTCYKDGKSQYLTPQVSKIIVDTSDILNKMSTGYQILLTSSEQTNKQVANDMFEQGLNQVNSVNTQNLPLLENINLLYSGTAKDFGIKEPDLNSSFDVVKTKYNLVKSKYRF